jgi:hypothetical protein
MVLIAILALLAACGGNGPGDGGDDGDDASQAAAQSEPAGASAAPPPDDGGGDGGGGDGGGGGPSGDDLEELLAALEPPNATEVSRTSADNFLFVIYTSTDSADSLADFYESAIADLGYDTISRSESQGVYSWIFADDSNADAAGVVGVGPTTDGGPGASVSIQLGTGE